MVNSRPPSFRSRTASYASEAYERALRMGKTQSGKMQRALNLVDAHKKNEKDMVLSVLDGLRAAAILSGIVSDYDGMSPIEYMDLCTFVMEEGNKLCVVLKGLIHEPICPAFSWYRVVKSAELAIPRIYLCLLVGKVYLSLDDAEFSEKLNDCTGIYSKRDLLVDIRMNCLALGDSIKGLAAHNCLLDFINCKDGPAFRLGFDELRPFLLEEFGLINRLWVRLYLDNGDPDVIGRHQLEEIVGVPIKMMAKRPDLSASVYSESILPILLQHMIACRDSLAQEFFTDLIIAEFPVELHHLTIVQLLDAISRFNATIDIRRLVSAVINRILPTKDDNDGDGGVLDSIWERISGLLLLRLESSKAEEAILLCTPILHHALSIKAFKAGRVELILEFIHLCAQRTVELNERGAVHLTKIFDFVVEFAPDASCLFALPSLFNILDCIDNVSVASCALLMIDRLVRDNITLVANSEKFNQFARAVQLVLENQKIEETMNLDDEELCNNVLVLQNLADNSFDRLIDPPHLLELGKKLIDVAKMSHNILAALFFALKLTNSRITVNANPETVKSVLRDLHKFLIEHPSSVAISRSRYEVSNNELREKLQFYLNDSQFITLSQSWAQCVKGWRKRTTTNAAENHNDDVYDAIVDILVNYEEEVTDHHAQCVILRLLRQLIIEAASCLKMTDLSLLMSRVHEYTRKLLKMDDRREIIFELLESTVQMGGKFEAKVTINMIESLVSLLPTDEIKDEVVLENCLRFGRLVLDFMTSINESVPELYPIACSQLGKIETFVATHPVKLLKLRDQADPLLSDWGRISATFPPQYNLDDQEIANVELLTHQTEELWINKKDPEPPSNAFSSFLPDYTDF